MLTARSARIPPLAGIALALSACAAKTEPRTAAIELDSRGAHPYLETVRTSVTQRLTYPCVRHAATGACEPLNTSVGIDFGILRDGTLGFVEVFRPSDDPIYDTTATEALRRAAPFPPVPPDLMARVPADSTGIPIRANVKFVVNPAR